MNEQRNIRDFDETPQIELGISVEKVAHILIKAREFDAKVPPVEIDPGSNPSDDNDVEILEDYADDTTLEELSDAIDGLNEDEAVDLVALVWLGRGDFSVEEWNRARGQAWELHRAHPAGYLAGIPQLGDYMEEGLAMIGRSIEEFEIDRL